MGVVVTPVPSPLVTKADDVFRLVNEEIMKEIGQSSSLVEVKDMVVSVNLEEGGEELFAKQDLQMKVDRVVTHRYVDILDGVVNRLK